jgi:hypothetical protein
LRLRDERDFERASATVWPLKQEVHGRLAAFAVKPGGSGTKGMLDEMSSNLLCPSGKFAHKPILP